MTTMNTHTLRVDRSNISVPAVDLVVTAQGGQQRRRLDLAPVVIGSGPDADIIVADPAVSRTHCSAVLTEQGLLLRDLGSRNGTFFGGARVRELVVPPGATVQLSQTTALLFQVVGEATSIPLSLNVSFGDAFGGSAVMRALFAVLERAASTTTTILLLGESGTGKELLARAVHAHSDRKNGPFVTVDCGAISPSLIESELFGHARGAFTGAVSERRGALAEADGGTLFLDEIGELPIDAQPKLLRALESRTFQPVGSNGYRSFDARIIAATHQDLSRARSEGRFREDLYFRLAVVQARVPPLRERRDDLEFLVERCLGDLRPPKSISDLPAGAMGMLREHDFPGNVRELKNTVTRLALFPELLREAFESGMRAGEAPSPLLEDALQLPLREARDQIVADFERRYIQAKLAQCKGNVTKAATSMGVSRQFLHRLMAEHGLRKGGADVDG